MVVHTINLETVTDTELSTFVTQTAARVIMSDADGRVALLYSVSENYHFLPGDCVAPGEDISLSLRRLCRDMVGGEILLGESLGEVHEYRRHTKIHHISYCFTAQLITEKYELMAGGYTLSWYFPDEALMIIAADTASQPTVSYILACDIALLTALLSRS